MAYEWPRPEVFENFGIRSLGFDEVLLLPVRLTPLDPEAPIDVGLT